MVEIVFCRVTRRGRKKKVIINTIIMMIVFILIINIMIMKGWMVYG